jgi:hypothetical protein
MVGIVLDVRQRTARLPARKPHLNKCAVQHIGAARHEEIEIDLVIVGAPNPPESRLLPQLSWKSPPQKVSHGAVLLH